MGAILELNTVQRQVLKTIKEKIMVNILTEEQAKELIKTHYLGTADRYTTRAEGMRQQAKEMREAGNDFSAAIFEDLANSSLNVAEAYRRDYVETLKKNGLS